MYKYNQVTTEVKNRKYLLPILGAVVSIVAFAALSAKAAPAPKVNVCHKDYKGFHMINISSNALQAHMNHGDLKPGPSGDVIVTDECETVSAWKLVDSFAVDSRQSTPTESTFSLDSTKTYKIESSGTWANSLNVSDTEYASSDSWVNHYDGYDIDPWHLGSSEFDLMVNGGFVDWGTYNDSHVYNYQTTGLSGNLNLLIFDGDSTNGNTTPDAGWYGDNSGSLSINVYERQY